MSVFRKRLAIALISLVVIGLELVLMRVLSLRFWHHFASMVISVALLGFGSSGTVIVLFKERFIASRGAWLCFLAFAFSFSIPVSIWVAQNVPLDMYYLAWNPLGEWFKILIIEFIMLVPFLFSGGFICLAFMDKTDLINGHYAANLTGSGIGAILTILLMHIASTGVLLIIMALTGYFAGAVILPWSKARARFAALCLGSGLLLMLRLVPPKIVFSEYKRLPIEKAKPETEMVYNTEGPLGRIDVVKGPTIHDAPPGMSLKNPHSIPQRILMIIDGDQAYAIYNATDIDDWAFLDYTTDALPYHLFQQPEVLIVGAGGGAAIGMALYHQSRKITALEANPRIIKSMKGGLAEFGGRIYGADKVGIKAKEARGFMAATKLRFDIIHVPMLDPLGISGSGVYAARESYLFTLESFKAMMDHLKSNGVLSVTLKTGNPPRDGLRVFDLAAQNLRAKGLNPVPRLALIRSWETVSLLVCSRPWEKEELAIIRSFCKEREFDLCYLPDLKDSEVNRYHILDRPDYFKAAGMLLGLQRQEFLKDYLFDIESPTDDRPYFFSFLRWRTLPELKKRLKGTMPAFLELGTLLLAVTLIQAVLLAVIMVIMPLLPDINELKESTGKGASLIYFFLIGTGFMLLEMGFLQKLILYLAHPIYSAAVVIASFLVFGGLGSNLSGRWASSDSGRKNPGYAASAAAGTIVIFSLIYLLFLDRWLGLTQALSFWARFSIASLTIAPLALAMGHLFPLGLRRVGEAVPVLIPWAWAINGFSSVIATISAPILAMNIGFSRIVMIAGACYAMAGIFFQRLPDSKKARAFLDHHSK